MDCKNSISFISTYLSYLLENISHPEKCCNNNNFQLYNKVGSVNDMTNHLQPQWAPCGW